MSAALGIDLNAAVRESKYPDGIPVTFGDKTFILPSELPVDVFDPLLDADFDLVGLIKALLDSTKADIGEALVDLLTNRPDLPVEIRDTIYACLGLLFGAEQFAQFRELRPGIGTYARLIGGLAKEYGSSLGEAFASPTSSESGGATSSPTSPGTTPASTPAPSGVAPEPSTGSSASVVSAP